MKTTMTILLMFTISIFAQAQGGALAGQGGPSSRGVVASVSPWPVYPPNGAIPPEFAGRHVFLDAHGDALIILTDQTGNRKMYRRELENHVAPEIHSAVAKDPSGTFTYQYSVVNGPNARQRLNAFSIAVPTLDSVQTSPDSWGTSKVTRQPSRLNWFAKYEASTVSKGSGAVGFQTASAYKPGITFAYFTGLAIGEGLAAGPPKVDMELPDDVQTEMAPLGQIEFNSVARLTIGPKFRPDANRQEIAADFHLGISRLINRGELDAKSAWVVATLTQLANFLDSAANGVNVEIVIRQQPSTPLEQEIASALKLSRNL
jgi:hypothetical protein